MKSELNMHHVNLEYVYLSKIIMKGVITCTFTLMYFSMLLKKNGK